METNDFFTHKLSLEKNRSPAQRTELKIYAPDPYQPHISKAKK